MIIENVNNMKDYSKVNSNFEKALKFLKENDLKNLALGKYEIDGAKVFANVQEYTTKPESEKRWESHRKYIDIQFIITGKEIMGYAPITCLEVEEDNLEEKDVKFYKETEHISRIEFNEGDYAIFFPEDGHKPGCALGQPSTVKKVVVKVAVE